MAAICSSSPSIFASAEKADSARGAAYLGESDRASAPRDAAPENVAALRSCARHGHRSRHHVTHRGQSHHHRPKRRQPEWSPPQQKGPAHARDVVIRARDGRPAPPPWLARRWAIDSSVMWGTIPPTSSPLAFCRRSYSKPPRRSACRLPEPVVVQSGRKQALGGAIASRHPRGVDGYPASSPLFRAPGGGARAAGRVEHEVGQGRR